jgi:hypothetical protein
MCILRYDLENLLRRNGVSFWMVPFHIDELVSYLMNHIVYRILCALSG